MNAQQLPETPVLLVSQEEAARLLGGVDRTTVWRMVNRGQLGRVKIGSRAMISRHSIDQYIALNMTPSLLR